MQMRLFRFSLGVGLLGFGGSLYGIYQYNLVKKFEKVYIELKEKK